jgi:nucleoside-diphosphate-sugar epimerase
MKSIFLTGHSGFVGQNFINTFTSHFIIEKYIKNSEIEINSDVVAHFAGLSHDIKGILDSDMYYEVNYNLSKKLFNVFLKSNARIFIILSSVKAVVDLSPTPLIESQQANPSTLFGKSKLLAEQYILSKEIPTGKRVYILRPCMIHGPGNKGNLNLLFQLVSMGIPWPLGGYENKRSFCGIDNLLFIIKELIDREDIPSGVYNISDDEPLSTNEVISIIAESQNRMPRIWNVSKRLIELAAKLGNVLKLPLNEDRLQKLTDSYVVSNTKLMSAIGKPLPVSSREGLLKTFQSFQ